MPPQHPSVHPRPRWRDRLAGWLRGVADAIDPKPFGLDLDGAPEAWAEHVRAAARRSGGRPADRWGRWSLRRLRAAARGPAPDGARASAADDDRSARRTRMTTREPTPSVRSHPTPEAAEAAGGRMGPLVRPRPTPVVDAADGRRPPGHGARDEGPLVRPRSSTLPGRTRGEDGPRPDALPARTLKIPGRTRGEDGPRPDALPPRTHEFPARARDDDRPRADALPARSLRIPARARDEGGSESDAAGSRLDARHPSRRAIPARTRQDDGSEFDGHVGSPFGADGSRLDALHRSPSELQRRARDDDRSEFEGEPGAPERTADWRISELPPYLPNTAVLPGSLWPALPARPPAVPVPAYPALALLRRERLQAEQGAT